ncbi:MAG: hypothetical protein N3F66_10595 [Spirochaetes bacterium]|nr:hypothetical protein [Spirochaetota bacterium]
MGKIDHLESTDFSDDVLLTAKGDKKIFVVFSTFGEREAELIYQKVSLIGALQCVDAIFVSHRRTYDDKIELTESKAIEASPKANVIVCNLVHVPDMGLERGKGADMRRALYYLITKLKADINNTVVVFLDADVLPQYFGPHFVLGLAGAVLQGYDFAKASFWRQMGRVKKYVAQPLLSAIAHSNLEPLQEFAYPLSGEVAGTLSFFTKVSFWQMYGVETGINVDAVLGDYKIADVNLGLYDHEHHNDVNIQKMSFGIIRTFLLQLIEYGYFELKNGAEISDVFRAQYIDEKGKRQYLEFNLSEKKYFPLCTII